MQLQWNPKIAMRHFLYIEGVVSLFGGQLSSNQTLVFNLVLVVYKGIFHGCSQAISSISGFIAFLAMVHDVYVPPGPEIYCRTYLYVLFSSYLVSTSLVGAMTFDRFYSIVAPHKAASFNTVKRAKITVACITIASIIYNLPITFSLPMIVGNAYRIRMLRGIYLGRFTIGYQWWFNLFYHL